MDGNKENRRVPTAVKLTHEEMLKRYGYDLCSPVSASMMPMVRPMRDAIVFVRPKGRLNKYDVALYRSHDMTIMHRVIGVKKDGYVIRGDNARGKEHVMEGQIIGVMEGMYRNETYIPCDDWKYRCYARLIVAAYPVLPLLKRIRRFVLERRMRRAG